MYGWCAASSASYALGGTFHAIVVSGIAMGLEVALDMARDLLVKDGSVYVTWKNLEVNVPVQYGTKNYQWAIDFVEAGDIQTDGVTWNLNNNSVHLRDDGKRNYVFAENSRLRKSSGQSYPGLVAVFPRDATATADSAAQFFRQYPELLPLVGGNPNKVRGLYGPFQVAVKGTIKDTRIPIENHVAFFCTEPLASSSGTTASALSARTAPLTVATMQAAGGTGSLARAAEAASSTETTRERLFLSNFRRADDCDSWLCAVDTDGAVKMTIDLSEAQLDGKEIEYVVPTVLGAKNIVVRDAQGNEIRQGGWEIFEQTTVIKPETDATAATFAINAANADPNHIMLEFDVLDGMVNRAEVVEVLVKYAGDETLYAVAPEGDGPNGGFRVDAAAVRSASYGGSSSGCSTGTAALAVAASAALLAAVQNIRRKRK